MGPVFIGPYLHACMKDFGSGHQARPDTRLCGAFRMSITAQSRTNDVVLLAARSFAPTAQLLRRARCRQGMAWQIPELVVTTHPPPAFTAAARRTSVTLQGRQDETTTDRTKTQSQYTPTRPMAH